MLPLLGTEMHTSTRVSEVAYPIHMRSAVRAHRDPNAAHGVSKVGRPVYGSCAAIVSRVGKLCLRYAILPEI